MVNSYFGKCLRNEKDQKTYKNILQFISNKSDCLFSDEYFSDFGSSSRNGNLRLITI